MAGTIGKGILEVGFDEAQAAADLQKTVTAATKSTKATVPVGLGVDSKAVAQAKAAVAQGVASSGPSRSAETAAAMERLNAAAKNAPNLPFENLGQGASKATPSVRGLSTAVSLMANEAGVAGGQLGQLASVLNTGGGAVGIVSAAVAATAALAALGEQMHDNNLSAKQLQELASKPTGDLVQATLGNFSFEDQAKSLKQLAQGGAEGIGTLLRLREQYAALGQPVDAFDKALADQHAAQTQVNETTARGQEILDSWSRSETQAAAAAKALVDRNKKLAQVAASALDAQRGLVGAEINAAGSADRVADAQARLRDAQREATKGVADQQRALASAVTSATEQLRKAQQAADAVTFAQTRAHLAAAEAEAEITLKQAQRAALRARTPDDRFAADKNLIAAKDDLAKSQENIAGQAQKEADAQTAVADAAANLYDAQVKQANFADTVVDKQRAVREAALGVQSALQAQAAAAADLIIQQRIASGDSVTDAERARIYRDQLGHVADQLNGPQHTAFLGYIKDVDDAAAHLQALIDKQNALTLASGTNHLDPSGRLVHDQRAPLIPDILGRAIGGPVAPFKPYIVGERGPELVIPNSAGTVIPNDALAALQGGRTVAEGAIVIHTTDSLEGANRAARELAFELVS